MGASRTRVLMDDELVASPYLRNTPNRDAPLRSEGVAGWLSLVTDGSRLAVDKTVPSCEEAVRAAGIAWAHVPVDRPTWTLPPRRRSCAPSTGCHGRA